MATAAVSLTLSGNPVTVPVSNPNVYYGTLVINSGTATAPSGTLTFTDSNSNTGTTSTWTLVGSGVPVAGQISFIASASIPYAENGGVTVQATYNGSDYTVSGSNTLTVSTYGELATSRKNYVDIFLAQTFPTASYSGGYGSQDNTNFVFQKDQYRSRNQKSGN